MGKIFKLMNAKGKTQIELPDITYVDEKYKALQDALSEFVLGHCSEHIKVRSFTSEPDVVEMPMPGSEPVRASRIIQSADQRMVSNAQVELFKKKPSLQQVKDLIAESSDAIKTEMNQLFSQLLNNQDSLKRLKAIIELVNNDDAMSQFIDVIANKASLDDLAVHANSHKHVTNTDRKALNLMLDAMQSGILNKMASGTIDEAKHAANADKLNGRGFEQISGHHLEQVIFAVVDATPESMYDIGLEPDKDGYMDNQFQNGLPSFGAVGFKPGIYKFKYFILKTMHFDDEFVVNGSGISTQIHVDKEIQISRSKISNMKFTGNNNSCEFIVGSKVDFTGCTFENMTIHISRCQEVYFDKCKFIKCQFKFNPPLDGVYITRCLFDKGTKQPMYIGTSVFIDGNMNL